MDVTRGSWGAGRGNMVLGLWNMGCGEMGSEQGNMGFGRGEMGYQQGELREKKGQTCVQGLSRGPTDVSIFETVRPGAVSMCWAADHWVWSSENGVCTEQGADTGR